MFEYKPQVDLTKLKKEVHNLSEYKPTNTLLTKSKDKKLGKNLKLFNALDTYSKTANPLINGKPNSTTRKKDL